MHGRRAEKFRDNPGLNMASRSEAMKRWKDGEVLAELVF